MKEVLVSLALLPALLLTANRPVPQQKALALAHLTIIDVTGGPSQADMTVVISGNQITKIGNTTSVALAEDVTVIRN